MTVSGGTHVPYSPCFEYLSRHWLHFINRLGTPADITMKRPGFYSRGGGSVRAEIFPISAVKPLILKERGLLLDIQGVSGSANLPDHVAERQRRQAMIRLDYYPLATISISRMTALSPGTVFLLLAEYQYGRSCFLAWESGASLRSRWRMRRSTNWRHF